MTEKNFKGLLEKVETSTAEDRLDNLRKLRSMVTQIDLEKYFNEQNDIFGKIFVDFTFYREYLVIVYNQILHI